MATRWSAPSYRAAADFRTTKGVAKVYAFDEGFIADRRKLAENTAPVTVADCASLREVASLPSCKDGDSFVVPAGGNDEAVTPGMFEPGSKLCSTRSTAP